MGRSTRVHYTPENPDKYVGEYPIVLRSSWEVHVAQYFDRHSDVLAWASEPVQIPYYNPVKNIQTVYVPDFLIRMISKDGEEKSMLIEVKPAHETYLTEAKDESDEMIIATNAAKWEAAVWWCQRRGIEFKVMTEGDIFAGAQSPAITAANVRRRKDKRGPIVKKALAAKKGIRKRRALKAKK